MRSGNSGSEVLISFSAGILPPARNALRTNQESKGVIMLPTSESNQSKMVEVLLREEMGLNGRIMVRTLDKIHARTGLTYAEVSEIAQRLEERYR